MLKSSYAKLEDIPAEQRGAYVLKDGKYVLDDLDAEHPVVIERNSLKTDVSAKQGQITKLTNDKTAAETRAIPDGHVAVPVADKQLLDAVKPFGEANVVKERLQKYPDLEKKEQERARQEHLRGVEKAMGWKEGSLALVPNLPELEVRDLVENGQPVKDDRNETKKTVVAKIPGENNTVTEKSFREVFDQTPALKAYEPLLVAQEQQQGGTELPPMGFGGGGGAEDLAGSIIKSRYGHNVPQAAKT